MRLVTAEEIEAEESFNDFTCTDTVQYVELLHELVASARSAVLQYGYDSELRELVF